MWWHTVTHGRGSEGETGEWSWYPVLFTLPRNVVYPALLPLTRTPLLPVIDWTDAPADLNGLVRFAERQNLVSARVSSHFKHSLPAEWDTAWAPEAGIGPLQNRKIFCFCLVEQLTKSNVSVERTPFLSLNFAPAPQIINMFQDFKLRNVSE